MVVRAENVVKRFHGTDAVNGVTLCAAEGETVSVIGSSGSGKSTLLRCIGGLERINAGSIELFGKTIAHDGAYPRERELLSACSRVGMVFQQFNLFPHMSVIDNITLAPIRLRGVAEDAARERAYSLLDTVGLLSKAQEYPAMLSGGQQQRIAIARALALEPELMLFDEPTSALDPELSGEVLQTINALAKTGITMIIVTHEMSFAQNISDRIVFMDEGKIVEEGAPEKLFTAPSTERLKKFLSA